MTPEREMEADYGRSSEGQQPQEQLEASPSRHEAQWPLENQTPGPIKFYESGFWHAGTAHLDLGYYQSNLGVESSMLEYSPRPGNTDFALADSINLNYGDLSPANFHHALANSNWIESPYLAPGYNSQEDYNPLRQLAFPN